MNHAPVSEAAFAASVTELTDEVADLDGFSEGYETWLASFQDDDAGVFTITLAEIAEMMEGALNQ